MVFVKITIIYSYCPTTMPRVVKARSHGEVKEVTYNRRGQSLGEVNTKMQSYLGVISTTTMPICNAPSRDSVQELLLRMKL